MEWWKKREVWLASLLVVLGAIAYKEVRAWLIPVVPPDLLSLPVAGSDRGPAMDAVSDVLLDRLAVGGSSYDPRGRNLFQYGKPAAPPPPPRPPSPTVDQLRKKQEEKKQQERVAKIIEDKRRAAEEARKRQEAMQPRPEVKAQASAAKPPPAKYKFMGYLGSPARRIAVLLDDGQVVLKREGEFLGDDFIVREIRFDSVELAYTDERFENEKALIPMGN
jgi:hypothetical protein